MKGEQHQVVVESLANSGDGVGRIQNKVVFIPFSCPGDKLLVEITLSKKTFLKAKIIKILEPAAQRINPPCPVFGSCGGCDWQHLPYQEQLQWKQKNLTDVLSRIGQIDDLSVVDDIIPSPTEFHYRNRIQLNQNNDSYYFYAKESHTPVPIKQCLIASETINTFLKEQKPKKTKGKVEFAETPEGVKTYKVSKEGHSELGFRQINSAQNQKLIDQTVQVISQYSLKKIYDLYCGQGNWAIAISQTLPGIQCTGVDIDPTNICKAKHFESDNLKFILGAAEKVFSNPKQSADIVIIDPPRAGCDAKLLETINKSNIPYLIYISCHPATLARDLKLLLAHQWELERITPVDMFPQTSHLETWCLLRSNS